MNYNIFVKFKIITLFPKIFPDNDDANGPLSHGLIGRALKDKQFSLEIIDLKNYANKNRMDFRPFGGGPGMIIRGDLLDNCFQVNNIKKLYFMSPRGKVFDQNKAKLMAKEEEITILCDRYEGIDERIFYKYDIEEISIGDFILCGGEVAAMTIIETVVRLLPNVLHNSESIVDESFENYLLEHSHFTYDRNLFGYDVPELLFNGNHLAIKEFRFGESLYRTLENRPDLFIKFLFSYFVVNILFRKFLKKII